MTLMRILVQQIQIKKIKKTLKIHGSSLHVMWKKLFPHKPIKLISFFLSFNFSKALLANPKKIPFKESGDKNDKTKYKSHIERVANKANSSQTTEGNANNDYILETMLSTFNFKDLPKVQWDDNLSFEQKYFKFFLCRKSWSIRQIEVLKESLTR